MVLMCKKIKKPKNMAVIGLNKISPSIRNKILSNKLGSYPSSTLGTALTTSDYRSEYIVNDDKKLNNYHQNLMVYTSELNVRESNDGYDGNVRRANYGKQWDKRGNIEEVNIWNNIQVPSKDLTEKWNDSKRNEYNNYIDYVNDIFGSPSSMINILGGIVTGKGNGVSLGNNNVGVVSNFDIQQTLAGRIYSTVTGNDTPLGKFGMKAAAISMANRTIDKTQRRVVDEVVNQGKNWLKGKITFWDKSDDTDFDPDFSDTSITVEKETNKKTITLFGKTIKLPVSTGTFNNIAELTGLYNSATKSRLDEASAITDIEQNLSPFYSIDSDGYNIIIPKFDLFLQSSTKGDLLVTTKMRNESLIQNSSKINVGFIYDSLNKNKYIPNYETDSRIKKGGLKVAPDYLQSLVDSNYINNVDFITYDGNTFTDRMSNGGDKGLDKFSWMERKGMERFDDLSMEIQYKYNDGNYYGDPNYLKTDKENTLLYKTQELFKNSKIKTIISAFGKPEERTSLTQSAIHPLWGMSKGRNLLKKSFWDGDFPGDQSAGYDDPYCRVWTWHKQYRTINDLIRPFNFDDDEIHKNLWFIRPGETSLNKNSVLQNNGFVKIAPYSSDAPWTSETNDVKKYMFSIENLAWRDVILEDNLCNSQIGSKGGRLMWFAPYNLKFSENVNVSINKEDFIGRGEPVLTYINTLRQGNLSFTLMVDHSSVINYTTKSYNNDENYEQALLRWNAGCDDMIDVSDIQYDPNQQPIPQPAESPTPPIVETDPAPSNEPPSTQMEPEKEELPPDEEYTLTRIYFPNDYSGVDDNLDAMEYIRWGFGGQIDTNNGPGYEMGGDKTLSNVKYKENPPTMYSIYDNSSVSNVKCDPKNDSVIKGNQYIWKKENITRADLVSHYGKTSRTQLGRDSEFLPRYRYNSFASYWDVENHSLNVTAPTGDKAISFKDFYEKCNSENTEGTEFYDLIKKAKKIIFTGNASSHGYQGDNIKLGTFRAQSVKKFLSSKLNINMNDNDKYEAKQDSIISVQGSTCSSSYTAKQGRFVEVKIILPGVVVKPVTEDILIEENENGELQTKNTTVESEPQTDDNVNVATSGNTYKKVPKLRYDEEKIFFQEYDKDTDLLMNKLKDKIKYFIPGLHSTTPEGFNARLGFLHQCTRQGQTNSATDDTQQSNATNLSFGRPPICILRLGDFYNTKIFIETMSIEYESQWDLNPEGIGVQPMMAHINLSFYFMGGQDIGSAISRLQNAITFNFYANQSVYDDRADFMDIKSTGNYIDEDGKTVVVTATQWASGIYNPQKYKNADRYSAHDEYNKEQQRIAAEERKELGNKLWKSYQDQVVQNIMEEKLNEQVDLSELTNVTIV